MGEAQTSRDGKGRYRVEHCAQSLPPLCGRAKEPQSLVDTGRAGGVDGLASISHSLGNGTHGVKVSAKKGLLHLWLIRTAPATRDG
jgi:hypothetical protein